MVSIWIENLVIFCNIIFAIFGIFGSFNIIIAVINFKNLQHSFGIILAILAFADGVCLSFEVASAIRMILRVYNVSSKYCFWINSFYIFIENFEVYLSFLLPLDRFIMIMFPFFPQKITHFLKLYITLSIIPGIFIGIYFITTSYIYMENEILEMCILPSSMPSSIAYIWGIYSFSIAILIFIVHIIIYIAMKYYVVLGEIDKKIQEKIIVTMRINMVLILMSSVLSALLILIMKFFHVIEKIIIDVNTLAVIPGLLSYTLNYYLYFWRSEDFRSAFIEVLRFLTLRKKKNSNKSTISTINRNFLTKNR